MNAARLLLKRIPQKDDTMAGIDMTLARSGAAREAPPDRAHPQALRRPASAIKAACRLSGAQPFPWRTCSSIVLTEDVS
ncbi:MAG TPA: hypothetical protein VJL88_10490 [Nitrospira sp.]|nr:hypothetical protein [Nitrospira sp.]